MAEKSDYQVRLQQVAKQLHIVDRQFSLICGINDNFLSSGQKDITTRQLVPILRTFPQVNPYYVLLGEGTPLIDEKFVNEGMIGRYLLQSFSELQVEVRQLIQENTILKAKLERYESPDTGKKKRLPKRQCIKPAENKQVEVAGKPTEK